MSKNILLPRDQIPQEQTWNLSSIFPDLESWEAAYQELEDLLPDLQQVQDTLAESPRSLYEGLQLWEKVLRNAHQVGMYASLDSSVDMVDQEKLARSGQGQGLMARAGAAAAFLEPELIEISLEKLTVWMKEFPELEIYRHYFEDLERQKDHLRSAEVEEVLAMSADPLGAISGTYGALTNADLAFEAAQTSEGGEREVGQSNIDDLITDPDWEVRKTAWKNYADAYLAHRNTLASTQTGGLKRDVYRTRVRRFESSLEASLFPVNIPLEVFHNLIEVFKENLPTWHRYWRLRREILGYDQLHVYDLKAPLTPAKTKVSYQQAVDWICEGMAPLGEEYVETLRKGCFENRWVDRSLNKGKRQGAFSAGTYDSQPFIMMSYRDDMFSLSTQIGRAHV